MLRRTNERFTKRIESRSKYLIVKRFEDGNFFISRFREYLPKL